MDKYEKQLVDYISNISYDKLSKTAIHSTKERVLDSFATAFAAYDSVPVKAQREIALKSNSSYGATVFGTKHVSTVYDAAIAFGTAVRAHDWNDTYLAKESAHPSDNICASFAVTEAEKKTGRDLITGIVLSYEMQCRLCDAAAIRKKGWDHVTYGSISSTAAAAKLMKLSPAQIRDAIGIAVTTGNYLRQTRIGTISNWEASAFAKAVRNAVEAALCVKHGFSGPSEIIAGKHGLINQITCGEFDLASRFGGQAGEEYKIVSTCIKYFPAVYHAQSAIWAALDLREHIGAGGWKNVKSILVETSHHAYEIIGMEKDKWHPKTKETADHSLPFITAVALMDGEVALNQFDQAHIENKRLLDLVQKVTVKEKQEYTDIYGTSFPNKITITLNNGKVLTNECKDPKGHPLNPLSKAEIETKFRNAAKGLIGDKQQDNIIDMVWNLENLTNVKELMDCLEVK